MNEHTLEVLRCEKMQGDIYIICIFWYAYYAAPCTRLWNTYMKAKGRDVNKRARFISFSRSTPLSLIEHVSSSVASKRRKVKTMGGQEVGKFIFLINQLNKDKTMKLQSRFNQLG